MIYVDPPFEWVPIPGTSNTVWSHMGTDDRTPEGLERFHAFAARIGLRRIWFQDKPGHPHYDLFMSVRRRALAAGAADADHREYLLKCTDYGPELLKSKKPIQKELFT